MNSATTLQVSTTGSQATQAVAAQLAKLLQGGETLILSSDLGGGKTTFVQGLAAGLGYSGLVTSPTFTISQVYRLSSSLELHHYDFYRLGEAGIIARELKEDIGDAGVITAIEWADVVAGQLPDDSLHIVIEATGENSRQLVFHGSGERPYNLIKALKAGTS